MNFTQYTIYNPAEGPGFDEKSLRHEFFSSNFRLLDQSITIANLYQNGRQSYEPYLHLHHADDLRESDVQYQKDVSVSVPLSRDEPSANVPPQPTSRHQILPTSAPQVTHLGNSIHENDVITNILMNDIPNLHSQPQNPLSFRPLPNLPSDNDKFLDVNQFISLCQHQKYYWLLDLFNELAVWKSVIPGYCLRLALDKLPPIDDARLLIDCWLSCLEDRLADVVPFERQLQAWDLANVADDLLPETLRALERILISIVLILLHYHLRCQRGYAIETQDTGVLSRQIELFHLVVAKLHPIVTRSRSPQQDSMVFVSCVHLVAVLRFFLAKYGVLPRWSRLDIDNMESAFHTFDFSQVSFRHGNPVLLGTHVSDSKRLRDVVWNLIRLEYVIQNPLDQIKVDYAFFSDLDPIKVAKDDKSVITSERDIAITLLREHVNGLLDPTARPGAVARARALLEHVDHSMVDADIKRHWVMNFQWLLRPD